MSIEQRVRTRVDLCASGRRSELKDQGSRMASWPGSGYYSYGYYPSPDNIDAIARYYPNPAANRGSRVPVYRKQTVPNDIFESDSVHATLLETDLSSPVPHENSPTQRDSEDSPVQDNEDSRLQLLLKIF